MIAAKMCAKWKGLPKNNSPSAAFAGKHEDDGDAGNLLFP